MRPPALVRLTVRILAWFAISACSKCLVMDIRIAERVGSIGTFCFFVFVAASPARAVDAPPEISGQTMGTSYSVKLRQLPQGRTPSDLQADIDRLLDEINDQMSTYRADSELSRFNRRASLEWFPVSADTAVVVARALAVAEDSGGAFDPTVGPLVRLWNFGPGPRTNQVPGDAEIDAALEIVGYEKVTARTDPPSLRKTVPGVELDLSAIAKGFAVDRVAEYLSGAGVADFMVEIGGEMRVSGSRPDGDAWRIGVEAPAIDARRAGWMLPLSDASLATSGDYRNYFESDGTRYSHTIDPRTGRPVTHSLASVTIVADDCATSDAWATTLMVLGPEEGLRWAEERKIAAWMLLHERDGISQQATLDFSERFGEPEPIGGVTAEGPPSWITFALAAALIGVAVIGLGIGGIVANRQLRGSCGGLAEMTDAAGNPVCSSCTNPPEDCDEFRRRVVDAAASDARDESPNRG